MELNNNFIRELKGSDDIKEDKKDLVAVP